MFYYESNLTKHEIKTDESQVVVFIPAIGLSKEEISVQTKGSALTIKGVPTDRGKPIFKEFELDDSLNSKDIKCHLKSGELKIIIPKRKSKARKITIE